MQCKPKEYMYVNPITDVVLWTPLWLLFIVSMTLSKAIKYSKMSRESLEFVVKFNMQNLRTSINRSINAEFVGRRYTTRPGAPAESVIGTIKKYILESLSTCTGISNIMKVGWKSVPGGWTGVEEATFTKSCSWQNIGLWACGPQSVSAAGCRNCGNTVWKVF